ncbi:TetR/AcrR family transcriptional regulator [Azospirillum halopraeferens]|uniref:TetR/AcrR family transcriptional regulator n=1 Tax=Azospirillum halopraeferens TaxID=34010 RepID=UPI0003F519EE|nr:TetR/AcrR family transcriptional regulator [Azospirillum halopraeferens]
MKRLARDERRQQLLDTAKRIVREEGVDALTLGHLAARAGVSKPVAYDHFGTREGLLVALYREIDDAHGAALQQALEDGAGTLEDAARAIGECYMTCSLFLGGEWHAITAALRGSEEMERVQRDLMDAYVAFYARILEPFTAARGADLRLRCVGIHGAAEHIARDMALGRTDAAGASAALRAIITGALR